jgi:hypothetical protein
VAVRVGGRGEPLRLPARPDGRAEGPRDVVARQVVVSQLGGGSWNGQLGAGQQRRQRGVQPGPFAGQEVGVNGFAQQGVPERIAVRAVRDEKLLGDGFPDRLLIPGVRQAARG